MELGALQSSRKRGECGKTPLGSQIGIFPKSKSPKISSKTLGLGDVEGQGIPWSCSSQNPVLPGNSAVPPGNSVPWEFCPHSHSPQSPPNPIPSFQARNEAWNPLFLAPKIPNPPGNGRQEGFHGIPAEPGPGVALGASGATQAAIFIPNLEFWPASSPGNVFPCSKASLFAHSQPFPGFLGKKMSFLCTKIGNFGVSMAEFQVLGLFVPVGDSKIPKVLEEQGRKGPCHPFFRDEFPKIPNSQQVRAE